MSYRAKLEQVCREEIARHINDTGESGHLLYRILLVRDAELDRLSEENDRLREQVTALMDSNGVKQIEKIEAELDALPEDERIRREAQAAPYLRIELAGWVRKAKEAEAELDKTSAAAAKKIWVKMGFDTILRWSGRAERAEARLKDLRSSVRTIADRLTDWCHDDTASKTIAGSIAGDLNALAENTAGDTDA